MGRYASHEVGPRPRFRRVANNPSIRKDALDETFFIATHYPDRTVGLRMPGTYQEFLVNAGQVE